MSDAGSPELGIEIVPLNPTGSPLGDSRNCLVDRPAIKAYMLDQGLTDLDTPKTQLHFHVVGPGEAGFLGKYEPDEGALIVKLPRDVSEEEANAALLYAAQGFIDHTKQPVAYNKEAVRKRWLNRAQRLGSYSLAGSIICTSIDVSFVGNADLEQGTLVTAGTSSALVALAYGIYRAGKFERRARAAEKLKHRFISFRPVNGEG